MIKDIGDWVDSVRRVKRIVKAIVIMCAVAIVVIGCIVIFY